MRPIDIACRHVDRDGSNCGAEAGDSCRLNADAHPLEYALHRDGLFHAERIEDAAAMSRVVDTVSSAAFEQAVEESGLV